MVWDTDFDVKEYLPKKQRRSVSETALFGGALAQPDIIPLDLTEKDRTLVDGGGGLMMTTAEILDFAEGSDSYAY